MGGITEAGASYHPLTAFVYIFNLIVGVGALALPIGFNSAGLFLGLIFLALLAFLAFVTVTWLNEVQSSANALLSFEEMNGSNPKEEISEKTRLIPVEPINAIEASDDKRNEFEITRRVEMGHMAELFLGSTGYKFFYAILVLYLFGDLSIYAITVPKSLAAVTGGFRMGSTHLSQDDAYYFFLALFAVCIVPFTFFNFQKTKYLQITTLFVRNLALFMMIIISIIYIGEGNGSSIKEIPFFSIKGLPNLFGVSIYAFMCHHSLPSIVTPINNKKRLTWLMGADFVCIFIVYTLMCFTAVIAFGNNTNPSCKYGSGPACALQQLYTLNFESYDVRFIATFLALFPVFTLSSNFPLIAITLRNNLMRVITYREETHHQLLRRIAFSLLSTVPPIVIAFSTHDVDLLVSITGSYPGLCIMFIIPAFLLMASRRKMAEYPNHESNPHQSLFGHKIWVILILIACFFSLIIITFNLIYFKILKHK